MSDPRGEAPRRTELLGLVPSVTKGLAQAVFAVIAVAVGAREISSNAFLMVTIAVLIVGSALLIAHHRRTHGGAALG